MKVICAWCEKDLVPDPAGGWISHGMCRRCELNMKWDIFVEKQRQRLRRYSNLELMKLFNGYHRVMQSARVLTELYADHHKPMVMLSMLEMRSRLRTCEKNVQEELIMRNM